MSKELDALAHEIAYIDSAHTIRELCPSQSENGIEWYGTEACYPEKWKADLARAVRYLELRGLLETHPEHADLVRVKEVS